MDITTTPSITNPNTTATNTPTSTKSPDHDSETPTRIPATAKPLSYSNGFLKRHPPPPPHNHHHHHNNHNHHLSSQPVPIIYKECLKNHAATLGGHALDGCGEFMPSPTATAADPSSIKCAACGCHRNFHRREPEEPIATTHVIEYQPHHRHHPPPPPPPLPPFQTSHRSPNSASPPPISSSYYPSAPHMLLALSAAPENAAAPANNLAIPSPNGRKRFRTKFTQDQKEKMYQFAERVGWKMQKRDDDLVHDFCNEIGVDRSVLKVWMHNNKNTFGKRDAVSDGTNLLEQQDPIHALPAEIHVSNSNGNATAQDPNHHGGYGNDNSAVNLGGTNGSSSSS